MSTDALCKECGHPISEHTMRRAEKRAQIHGTIVSDYPSNRNEPFNYHSGQSDKDACVKEECSCVMFVSPFV